MKTTGFPFGFSITDFENLLFSKILGIFLQLLGDSGDFLWCYES